jgi:hypothetical protein
VHSLERTFHRCFLPSFRSIGSAVSEEKIKTWKVNGYVQYINNVLVKYMTKWYILLSDLSWTNIICLLSVMRIVFCLLYCSYDKFLAHLAKGNVSFCHHLASIIINNQFHKHRTSITLNNKVTCIVNLFYFIQYSMKTKIGKKCVLWIVHHWARNWNTWTGAIIKFNWIMIYMMWSFITIFFSKKMMYAQLTIRCVYLAS